MKRSASLNHQPGQERPSKVQRRRGSDTEAWKELRGADKLLQHPLSPFSSEYAKRDPNPSQRGRTRTRTPRTERTDEIYNWIPAPEHIDGIEDNNMSHTSSKRARSLSASSDGGRSRSPDSERSSLRDFKSSSPYKAVNYVTILETKGYFMRQSQEGPVPEDIQLCQRLLRQSIETPRGTMFDPEFVQHFHTALQNRSESRLLVDLHPLLIPSAENLHIQGKEYLKDVVDTYNDPWLKTEPIYGPKPQPDHARGLKWSTFSETQRRKLGIKPDAKSPYTAREDMYFPYLTAEVKCGNQALELADRQNMHSMCIALRAIVTLAQAAGCVETLHRRILGFSISHELEGIRIYGYYPEMNGERISFFRWPVAQQLSVWENGNQWTCYRFVENLDRIFLPAHVKRLMEFLEKIPDPGDNVVKAEATEFLSPSLDSQERPSNWRTPSSQSRGLQTALRNMIQTLQQQLEQQRSREAEQKELLLAQLEQQRLREAEQKEQFLTQLEQQRLREEKILAQLEEQRSREAEQKQQFLAQLEQQRLREEEREAKRNAREEKLLSLLEGK